MLRLSISPTGMPEPTNNTTRSLSMRMAEILASSSGTVAYGTPRGYRPLRDQLQIRLGDLGIAADPSQIVLTPGRHTRARHHLPLSGQTRRMRICRRSRLLEPVLGPAPAGSPLTPNRPAACSSGPKLPASATPRNSPRRQHALASCLRRATSSGRRCSRRHGCASMWPIRLTRGLNAFSEKRSDSPSGQSYLPSKPTAKAQRGKVFAKKEISINTSFPFMHSALLCVPFAPSRLRGGCSVFKCNRPG